MTDALVATGKADRLHRVSWPEVFLERLHVSLVEEAPMRDMPLL